MRTFNIPAGNLDALQAEIEKMNKRAKRLNCSPLVLNVLGHTDIKNRKTRTITRTYQVQVIGELPCVSGWTLAAVLNHNAADETIVKTLPEQTIPNLYRTRVYCDHCHTVRYRTDTFVLRNESGEFQQVGRNCLADFLRIGDGNILAGWFEFIRIHEFCEDAEADDWRGFRQPIMVDLECYLIGVQGTIHWYGWKSASNGEPGYCTADLAWLSYFSQLPAEYEELRKLALEKNPYTPDKVELKKQEVQAAVAWVKAQSVNSDYMRNLQVIVNSGYVTEKTTRLAASIIPTYKRELEKQAQAAESKHFGTVRKREVFTLTLDSITELAGSCGITYLHKFHDTQGNIAVWFASNSLGEKGEYKLKATVKAHSTYNNMPQTILSRCNKV